MADFIEEELREGDGKECGVCKKTIAGSAFSVMHVGGFFSPDASEELVKIYLCSSHCREQHIGEFWRAVFPCK